MPRLPPTIHGAATRTSATNERSSDAAALAGAAARDGSPLQRRATPASLQLPPVASARAASNVSGHCHTRPPLPRWRAAAYLRLRRIALSKGGRSPRSANPPIVSRDYEFTSVQ